MSKISSNNFQKGLFIEFKGEIHQIVDFQHVNPGKGSAFIRTKLRNIKNGNTLDFTYKSAEKVEEVQVFTKEMQYIYKSENKYFFMDKDSFEQYSLSESIIGGFKNYLKEGEIYQLYLSDNQLLGLKMPKKVKLSVIEAEEGVKGNTVTGAKKTVKLESGIIIKVPLFIKKGDMIAVNPETAEYLERIN